MALDQNLRQITEANGRTTYISVRDIRSFYNFESKLLIEMIDGTVYEVQGGQNVVAFYNSVFLLDPREITITNNPIEAHLTNNPLNTNITNNPLNTNITNNPLNMNITNNPLNVNLTNNPVPTKEQLTGLTITSNVVTVGAADTLVLAANPNRKFLLIQRGTTIGRVFVKFSAGAATVTNGVLFREDIMFTMPFEGNIYTGEIRGISVGSSKILYVTEGV